MQRDPCEFHALSGCCQPSGDGPVLKIHKMTKRDWMTIPEAALPAYAADSIERRFSKNMPNFHKKEGHPEQPYLVRSCSENKTGVLAAEAPGSDRSQGPILGVLWICHEHFDEAQIICHMNVLPDIEFGPVHWRALLDYVQERYTDVYCIHWLLQENRIDAAAVFEKFSYAFDSNRYLELPDERYGGIYFRYLIMRQYHFERPGQGIAFSLFPAGLLAAAGTGQAIRAVEFLRSGEMIANRTIRWKAQSLGLLQDNGLLKPELSDSDQHRLREDAALQPEVVCKAKIQLDEYVAGNRKDFDIPLDLAQGSEFQQKVWHSIGSIPYGVTATYEDLAAKLVTGNQKSANLARAVGSACSANPLPVFVPCHRVIGKSGKLVGFNGGLDIKEYLLNHEVLGV